MRPWLQEFSIKTSEKYPRYGYGVEIWGSNRTRIALVAFPDGTTGIQVYNVTEDWVMKMPTDEDREWAETFIRQCFGVSAADHTFWGDINDVNDSWCISSFNQLRYYNPEIGVMILGIKPAVLLDYPPSREVTPIGVERKILDWKNKAILLLATIPTNAANAALNQFRLKR